MSVHITADVDDVVGHEIFICYLNFSFVESFGHSEQSSVYQRRVFLEERVDAKGVSALWTTVR